jgi:hypothetical protein
VPVDLREAARGQSRLLALAEVDAGCDGCGQDGSGWDAAAGGALRIHAGGRQGAGSAVHVLPECGRLAMFYADSMPHEVEACFRERHAVTVRRRLCPCAPRCHRSACLSV